MKLEAEKFLQSIDLKLRGRTAVFAIGEGVMVIALWLFLKDYSAHPLLSILASISLLVAIFGFLALGLLGKPRPDEAPEKSLTHIEQMGISIVHGISSHKDMVRIMREISGMRRLPPPSHTVRGSAANERDYLPLTAEESNEIAEQIERGAERLLIDAVKRATSESKEPQLQESSTQNSEDAAKVKGKTFV